MADPNTISSEEANDLLQAVVAQRDAYANQAAQLGAQSGEAVKAPEISVETINS